MNTEIYKKMWEGTVKSYQLFNELEQYLYDQLRKEIIPNEGDVIADPLNRYVKLDRRDMHLIIEVCKMYAARQDPMENGSDADDINRVAAIADEDDRWNALVSSTVFFNSFGKVKTADTTTVTYWDGEY